MDCLTCKKEPCDKCGKDKNCYSSKFYEPPDWISNKSIVKDREGDLYIITSINCANDARNSFASLSLNQEFIDPKTGIPNLLISRIITINGIIENYTFVRFMTDEEVERGFVEK